MPVSVFSSIGLRVPVFSPVVKPPAVRFSGGKAANDDSLLSRDSGTDRFTPVVKKELPIPQEEGMVWRTTGWAPDERFWNAMGGYPSDREVRAYHRELEKILKEEGFSETASAPGKSTKKTLKAPKQEGSNIVKDSPAKQSTQTKSRVFYQDINPKFLEALIKARKEDIRGNKEKKRPIVYGLYTGIDQSGKKKGVVGIQTEVDKTDPRAITGRQIETWIEARQRDQSKDTEEWHE